MKPVSVLDIGSSKVVCLCGASAHVDGIMVYGVGTAPYEGFDGGEFSNEDSLHDAILTAVEQAEQQSGSRIREIAIAVPANFCKIVTTQATSRVESKKKRFLVADIDELEERAVSKATCEGHILMHNTALCYIVDGEETDEPPINERAAEVSVIVTCTFVEEGFVSRFEKILQDLDIGISLFLSAALAEARHIIPQEERVRPAVLIDVGYTHTEISVIENSCVTRMLTFEAGGYQIASDLSFGLDIPLEYAEQVKRRYAFLQDPLSKVEIVRMPTGVRKFDHQDVKLIVESRTEELCTLIRDALEQLEIRPELRPAIYLTGGGLSPMRSSGEYLREQLGMPVKRDIPSYLHEMNSPSYTSAFGALDFVLYASRPLQQAVEEEAEQHTSGSLIARIRDFLTKE